MRHLILYVSSIGIPGVGCGLLVIQSANFLMVTDHIPPTGHTATRHVALFSNIDRQPRFDMCDISTFGINSVKKPTLGIRLGHCARINALALTSDQQYLVTASADCTVRLWNVSKARELRCFIGHSASVTAVATSGNDKWLATSSDDHTARIWDLLSGKQLCCLTDDTGTGIQGMVMSDDAKWLVTASGLGQILLWDAATGKKVHSFPSNRDVMPSIVSSIALSKDGKTLVTGSNDNAVCIWDTETGKLRRRLLGHSAPIESVALSANNKWLATGSRDHTAKLWEIASGGEVTAFIGHSDVVHHIAMTDDGKRLITGSLDNTVRLWDTITGKETRRLDTGPIGGFVVSRDGNRVITGDSKYGACMWDCVTEKQVTCFARTALSVGSIAMSDQKAIAIKDYWEGDVHIWDASRGAQILNLPGVLCTSVALAGNGSSLVLGRLNGYSHYAGILTGHAVEHGASLNRVDCVALSLDGKMLATGGHDKSASLWELSRNKMVKTLNGHSDTVSALAFTDDGLSLVSGSVDKTAKLWRLADGCEVRSFNGHEAPVKSVSISSDGKWLATSGDDNTVRIWEMSSGKEVHCLSQLNVLSIAMTGDGVLLAVGMANGSVAVYDVRNGKKLKDLKGHSGRVFAVVFGKGGKYLWTGSFDATTRVWDVAMGKELCKIINFEDGTWAVCDDDGRYDSSDRGSNANLYWIVDQDILQITEFKEHYYDPGLLCKCLRIYGETPRPIRRK
jgi:WD40 repeat protein